MNLVAMEQQIQVITGKRCSFIDLFSQEFIEKYTDFSTLIELERSLPFDLKDLKIVSDVKLNVFVKNHTNFDSWQQFITAATIFYN